MAHLGTFGSIWQHGYSTPALQRCSKKEENNGQRTAPFLRKSGGKTFGKTKIELFGKVWWKMKGNLGDGQKIIN